MSTPPCYNNTTYIQYDSMILIYKTDLTVLKVYLHTKNELSTSKLSEVI